MPIEPFEMGVARPAGGDRRGRVAAKPVIPTINTSASVLPGTPSPATVTIADDDAA